MYLGIRAPMGNIIKKPMQQRRAWFLACSSRGFKGIDTSVSDMVRNTGESWAGGGGEALTVFILYSIPQFEADRGCPSKIINRTKVIG